MIAEGISSRSFGYAHKHQNSIQKKVGDAFPVVTGEPLREHLAAKKGDQLQFKVLPVTQGHLIRKASLVGTFQSGFWEYDSKMLVTSLENAQDLMNMGKTVSGFLVWVDDLNKIDEVSKNILAKLGDESFYAVSWTALNLGFFGALSADAAARKEDRKKVLLSQVFGKDKGCLVTLSIYDIDTQKVLISASAQSACKQEDISSALEQAWVGLGPK